MSRLTAIVDEKNLCGESPIWDVAHRQLYWTDCVGLKFFRYDWDTKKHYTLNDGFEINGYALAEPTGFVITNNAGIWWWDGQERKLKIADQIENSKCQMNDCVADVRGRLIAGSWFYDPAGEYPLGKLI